MRPVQRRHLSRRQGSDGVRGVQLRRVLSSRRSRPNPLRGGQLLGRHGQRCAVGLRRLPSWGLLRARFDSAANLLGRRHQCHGWSHIMQCVRRWHLPRWRGRHLFKEGELYQMESIPVNCLTTYGTLMRRGAIEKVGNFDASLKHSEDHELGRRLMKAGYSLLGIPSLVTYSIRRDTLSSVLERYWIWHERTSVPYAF